MHWMSYRPALCAIVAGYAAGGAWFVVQPGLAAATELTPRILIAFLLPTAAAILLWLFSVVELRRPPCAREPGDCAATGRIVLRFVLFISALQGLVILHVSEVAWIRPWLSRLAFVLLGALLVSVGNLLPTTRPNVLVGIRTSRSLNSRRFWMEINRVGGYAFVALGLVVIVAGVVLRYPLAGQVITVASLAAVGVVTTRYRRLARDARWS